MAEQSSTQEILNQVYDSTNKQIKVFPVNATASNSNPPFNDLSMQEICNSIYSNGKINFINI